jgi:hypothetical protein
VLIGGHVAEDLVHHGEVDRPIRQRDPVSSSRREREAAVERREVLIGEGGRRRRDIDADGFGNAGEVGAAPTVDR